MTKICVRVSWMGSSYDVTHEADHFDFIEKFLYNLLIIKQKGVNYGEKQKFF